MSLPTTSKLLLTVTVALAMTATAAGAAPSAQGLPQAGAVVGTLPIPPSHGVLFAPRGRSLFVVDFPQSRVTTIEVLRVNADRTITRNRVRFDLPDYLADLSAGPDGLYAGTAVIKRFTQRRDELVRIDANTLRVRKRVFFPASVAVLERGRRMWASLGDGHVLRLDPRTLAIDASRRVFSAAARVRGAIVSKPAVGLGSLWVLAGDERDLRLVRMDPITLAIRSATRIPTHGDLAQALSSVVADSGHVYLVGHAIAAVDATGSLIGRPVLVADLETAAIYGNGLVGVTNGKPVLVLLDQHGKLLARTTLRDGGGQLAVSGQNVWFLGDGGKGEGIVHVRLSNVGARTRALASRSRTSARRCPKLVTLARDLGTLAFVRAGDLDLLDVRNCSVRTLVAGGVASPLRWSADGHYLAFSNGSVVAAGGGKVRHPLGRLAPGWGSGSSGWAWSPSGHRLAGVTSKGGVLIGRPGRRPQRLLADGWGATSVAFAPEGRTLAVSRSRYLKTPAPYDQEIWAIDLKSRHGREIFHQPKHALAPPYLYGFSPDGRWLIAWEDTQNSASLAADGLPLIAVPISGGRPVRVGKGTLVYGDFLSWCNNALAYVLNRGGREVTLGDRVAMANPPDWTVTVAPGRLHDTHSYNSPACNSDLFELAAAVGPTTADEPFGHEHRRIWLLSYTGGNWQPLEPPPPPGSPTSCRSGRETAAGSPSSEHAGRRRKAKGLAAFTCSTSAGASRGTPSSLVRSPPSAPAAITTATTAGPTSSPGAADEYVHHDLFTRLRLFCAASLFAP